MENDNLVTNVASAALNTPVVQSGFQSDFLPSAVFLLATAIFVVILFKKLRLSPVLGYLVAGAIIGDNGLNIIKYSQIEILAEYGVVFLLFAIGLELSFERLKVMRKYVFGLGTLQVVITVIAVTSYVIYITTNVSAGIIIGGGLALSSTAIVLQVLEENKNQNTQLGRISLAILILQDFIVVPLLVIVKILAGGHLELLPVMIAEAFMNAFIALIAIFICGKLFLRPMFKLIGSDNNEIFIGATLLIVLSAAFGTEHFGLSQGLGAFVAGVLVAETEFQIKAEESIYPFKGLLLGLFFMSVGMTINMHDIVAQIDKILILTLAIVLLKTIIITGLCMLFGFSKSIAIHAGLLLSQGSEFAFILFKMGMSEGILDESLGKLLLIVVTTSMALTPLLNIIGHKIGDMIDDDDSQSPTKIIEKGARDITNHVIVGGCGKVGKMVAKMMDVEAVNHIIIDINDSTVKEEESNGYPIFKGDISQLDTLQACGADRALALVLAMNNKVTLKKAVKTVNKTFPNLYIIVRSSDLSQSAELYSCGASVIVPADYETGLQLGGAVLKSIGTSENEIARIKNQFRAGNYVMAKQDADIHDEYEEH